MKKNILLIILLVMGGIPLLAQQPIRKGDPIRNLLDMPGYKKDPIKFEAFVAGPDAAKRGFKADSIYSWLDKSGRRVKMSGAEILRQVNEMEKGLCERGHSLRQANTFEGLKLVVPRNYANKIESIPPGFKKYSHRLSPKINTEKPPVINQNRIGKSVGIVYPYFGYIANSNEFPGQLYNDAIINDKQKTAELILSLSDKMFAKVGSAVMHVYDNESKSGTPVYSQPINVQEPEKSRVWSGQLIIDDNASIPNVTTKLVLYKYELNLNDFQTSIPKATREKQYYYVNFLFYDKSGGELLYFNGNNIRFVNWEAPPLYIATPPNTSFIDPVNYELGALGFGVYMKSTGINAKIKKEKTTPDSYYGTTTTAAFNANLQIGFQYFNIKHLFNDSEPYSKQFDIVGFDFSGLANQIRADVENPPPPIRVAGKGTSLNLLDNPNTKLSIRVWGEERTSYSEVYNIFDQRFFIGPVPCRATINIVPSISVTASGSYNRYKPTSITGEIVTKAKIDVEGSGGVDAGGIIWAKIVADVNVMDITMPIQFTIDGEKITSDVNSSVNLSALSGQLYFNAGVCIPIPFFDDICKSFSIPIVDWKAPLSGTAYSVETKNTKTY